MKWDWFRIAISICCLTLVSVSLFKLDLHLNFYSTPPAPQVNNPPPVYVPQPSNLLPTNDGKQQNQKSDNHRQAQQNESTPAQITQKDPESNSPPEPTPIPRLTPSPTPEIEEEPKIIPPERVRCQELIRQETEDHPAPQECEQYRKDVYKIMTPAPQHRRRIDYRPPE